MKTEIINSNIISGIDAKSPLVIPSPFIDSILKPYRDHAKYLTSAEITHYLDKEPGTAIPAGCENLITSRGIFSIPESCYIDDTGHFNAVEFNICFNQLAYVTFGMALKEGIMQNLVDRPGSKIRLDYDIFREHQLSSMLIVKLESKFLKQLDSDLFFGEMSINRFSSAGKSLFAYTSIAFFDNEGVKSKGSVLLAFNSAHE